MSILREVLPDLGKYLTIKMRRTKLAKIVAENFFWFEKMSLEE